MMTRRTLVGGALFAAVAVPLASAPALAAGPTSVTITGEDISARLTIRNDADPELFAALVSQVTWMATRAGQTSRPANDKLGPKYTIVVFTKDRAQQTYDLYPLASGGPRAFRPAKQPDLRSTTAAWFYGRLTMPETLRRAGVPLSARSNALHGGTGGGAGGTEDEIEQVAFAPAEDLAAMLAQWRRLFLLNGAVVLLIAAGLAGFARLIRPKG